MQALSPTWDKALTQIYQIKQDVVSMVDQNARGGQDTSIEELQKYKGQKRQGGRKAFKEATPPTSTRAPAPDSAKEKYWEKEAKKYQQLYQVTNEKYEAELPSTECIQLIWETTLENQKLVSKQ